MAKPIINEILAKELRGEKYRTSLTDISENVNPIKNFKWTQFVKSTQEKIAIHPTLKGTEEGKEVVLTLGNQKSQRKGNKKKKGKGQG